MSSQQQSIQRRRKMAEALLRQGVDASPTNPLGAVARVLQAYLGTKEMAGANDEEKRFEAGLQEKLAAALSQYGQLSQGSPGVTPLTPNDDEGNPMPSSPATPPDPRAANMALLNSGVPMLQEFGVKAMLQKPKPADPFTLKPGETRFGPDGKPIVALPAAEKPQGPKLGDRRERFDGGSVIQEEYTDKGWQPFGQGPRFNPKSGTTVNVNGPKETFKNEKDLRSEFTDASKSFVKVREAYTQVKDALSGKITAPATLAGATKFMKMLDPESVVRESELNMALRSTGLLDRFLNLQRTLQEGGTFTDKQAAEVQRIASVLYETAAKQQARVEAHFTKLATDYKLDPSRVVRNLGAETDNKLIRNEDGSWTYQP